MAIQIGDTVDITSGYSKGCIGNVAKIKRCTSGQVLVWVQVSKMTSVVCSLDELRKYEGNLPHGSPISVGWRDSI